MDVASDGEIFCKKGSIYNMESEEGASADIE